MISSSDDNKILDDSALIARIERIAIRSADPSGSLKDYCWILPKHPIAFEEILLPFVTVAAELIDASLACFQPESPCDASPSYRFLLANISNISSKAIFLLLDLHRKKHENVFSAYGIAKLNSERVLYNDFTRKLLASGLNDLWFAYPALKTIIMKRVHGFIASFIELIERFHRDKTAIKNIFFDHNCSVELKSIEMGFSDLHNGGKSVARLIFQSNDILFYKPRTMDMQLGWETFVNEFNALKHGLPTLMPLQLLTRGEYGWSKGYTYTHCHASEELALFYNRAGMCFALLDLFGGIDCHFENIVAIGEHPMLIDLETMFHPKTPWEKFDSTLSRTGFLPSINSLALAGLTLEKSKDNLTVDTWFNINTDNMSLTPQDVEIPIGLNVPSLSGGTKPAYAKEFADDIESGFSSIHKFFSENPKIWDKHGIVSTCFRAKKARFLIRDTKHYYNLLARASLPENLSSVTRYTNILKKIESVDKYSKEEWSVWQDVFNAEVEELAEFDIPVFFTNTDSRTIQTSRRQMRCFLEDTPFNLTRKRALAADNKQIGKKIELLRMLLK